MSGFAVWKDIERHRLHNLRRAHREPFAHVAHIRRRAYLDRRYAEMRSRRGGAR